ncbi:MAG: aminotransferase class V-fold PLP-dependent enzyme, partial [Pseudomonadota bacterium]
MSVTFISRLRQWGWVISRQPGGERVADDHGAAGTSDFDLVWCFFNASGGIMDIGRTYLDYNATTPLRPGVRDVLIDALDQFGNPSSVHAEGRTARSYVSKAKTQVAKLVGGSANDIVFCSSATEALNMVVQSNWDSVITLRTEHAAVLAPAKTYDTANLSIEVTDDGI